MRGCEALPFPWYSGLTIFFNRDPRLSSQGCQAGPAKLSRAGALVAGASEMSIGGVAGGATATHCLNKMPPKNWEAVGWQEA